MIIFMNAPLEFDKHPIVFPIDISKHCIPNSVPTIVGLVARLALFGTAPVPQEVAPHAAPKSPPAKPGDFGGRQEKSIETCKISGGLHLSLHVYMICVYNYNIYIYMYDIITS